MTSYEEDRQPLNNQDHVQGNADYEPYEEEKVMGLTESSRIGFIRKVYGILSVQLLLTFASVCCSCFIETYANWQIKNQWLLWVVLSITIVTIYALVCYKEIARKVPTNYILLMLFTFSEAYMVGFICTTYSKEDVFIAAALTAGVVVGLTVYAFKTKTDFTMMGGLLFIMLFTLVIASILSAFFYSRWLTIVVSCFGVIIFGLYLVYDTQQIIGGKTHELGMDDYIFAAMSLYLDIINIFIYILQIIGNK